MNKNTKSAFKTLVTEQLRANVRRLAREVSVEYGLADRTGGELYVILLETDPS